MNATLFSKPAYCAIRVSIRFKYLMINLVIVTGLSGYCIPAVCQSQLVQHSSSSRSLEELRNNHTVDTDHFFYNDSILKKRFDSIFSASYVIPQKPDVKSVPEQVNAYTSKPLLRFDGGYISYSYSYRSGLDTPYTTQSVSQHFTNASFNAIVANTVPFRINFFDRETNSPFFRSYRDVRIDVDVQKYKQLRAQRQMSYFNNYAASLHDPFTTEALQSVGTRLKQYKRWMYDPIVVSELIKSKETIIRKEFQDTTLGYRDYILERANNFIHLCDSIERCSRHFEKLHDSLLQTIKNTEETIKSIQQLSSGRMLTSDESKQLIARYGQNDEHVKQLLHSYDGIRVFSLGKSVPNYSSLSLQNVNINGINLEYAHSPFFIAATAGAVDLRIRDFVYKQQHLPKQYVYAGKLGYGNKDKTYLLFTYFGGKKQLYGGNTGGSLTSIQGIGLSSQLYIAKQLSVYGEVAQSVIPYTPAGLFTGKSKFNLGDPSQKAYAVGLISDWQRSKTRLDGYFQHTGLNYQSFNSFQYNTVTSRWSGRLEQHLWKNQVQVLLSVRKNDFSNPLILQRYNANTVFKNLSVTFHKSKWPSVSIGYLPSAQYSVIDSQVYENHYQTLTGMMSYQYKLGMLKATSAFVFSRFYNANKDSGFIYYNSKNVYWNQLFAFEKFNAAINVTATVNSQYRLYVMEEQLSAVFLKKLSLGGAVKISNLNNELTKVGFNSTARFIIKNIGELSFWLEKSYLPSTRNELYKYEFYTVGLVRYIK